MMAQALHLRILGTRGVPARHGGFETFAQQLALHLVAKGWQVSVYCQAGPDDPAGIDQWRGIHRVMIPVAEGSMGSIAFDWQSVRDAASHQDLCLTLGYNTAIFCAWLKLQGVCNVINMDGIEWARGKWGLLSRAWLWANDWAGCWLADRLVADHPEIQSMLSRRGFASRTTMIAYGANEVVHADPAAVHALGLQPGRYFLVVARPEPENSILEIVKAHAASNVAGHPLVLLGHYPADAGYTAVVRAAACSDVRFAGPLYDPQAVAALRFHATAYVHGHQVGGTAPTLVESMACGAPIIARENRFNRWVAGEAALYFADTASCATCMERLVRDPVLAQALRTESLRRFREAFTLEAIHAQYEMLLREVAGVAAQPVVAPMQS
jgi:glycosyltransferase involved in cell wall biosynthesis